MSAILQPVPRRLPYIPMLFAAALLIGIAWGAWVHRNMGTWQEKRMVFGGMIPAEIMIHVPREATLSAQQITGAAFDAIKHVSSLMNAYQETSDIGRLNTAEPQTPIPVAPETFMVLLEAQRFHRLSGGAFDITVMPLAAIYKPLITAFQDSGEEPTALPSEDIVAAARAAVGSQFLYLDENSLTVTLQRDHMRVDLGAIAKGYAVDAAIQALKKCGIRNGLVSIGGEVRTIGTHPDGSPWNIAITNPAHPGKTSQTLHLSAASVATSGNYHQFFDFQGKRYSHIIDPRTGLPLTNALVSVTVISHTSCTAADALATAVSVLGVDEGKKLLALFPDTQAIIAIRNLDGTITEVQFPETVQFPRLDRMETKSGSTLESDKQNP